MSSTNREEKNHCKVDLTINIPEIVRYSCIASVLIVLIVFASSTIKCFIKNK